jgi:Tol biopolymer transport system component
MLRRIAAGRLAVSLVAGTAVAAMATPATPPTWALVSESFVGGSTGDSDSYEACVTPNGRLVFFCSQASDLVADPGNDNGDIFVRDMKTGITSLVSANVDGDEGDDGSWYPAASNNGRYVVFESDATDLVEGDDEARADVFLADRKSGEIRRISEAEDGTGGDDNSEVYGASMSGNGRWIVFYSGATNLTDDGSAGSQQVFLYDRVKRALRRLSSTDAGGPGDGGSREPSVSANGRFVAFESSATDIPDAVANGRQNIFLCDTRTDAIERVSRGLLDADPTGDSYEAAVSNNGRAVAFFSDANNLVAGDTNGLFDTFLVDPSAGTTTRISTGPEGAEGNGHSWTPAVSASGKVVAFYSTATNLVSTPMDGNGQAYRWDAATGALTLLSVNADGESGTGYTYLFAPSLSSNGRWLAVASGATNLVDGITDTNTGYDDYVIRVK